MASLILISRVSENRTEFETKVRKIASNLGVDPNFLMIVMYKESLLNHLAVNAKSGATGLIQFMPTTAKSLGTTTAALAAMSNIQQLDYVEKYLRPYKSKFSNRLIDLYLAVFYPAAIGKPDTHIIAKQGTAVYSQNAGLDLNKNGEITVLDIAHWLQSKIPAEAVTYLETKKKQLMSQATPTPLSSPPQGSLPLSED